MQTFDRLSSTFAALSDPTRRAILSRLTRGETSVTDLAKPFDLSLPAISKHLKVLEKAGLISRGREAQWRPCRLAASPLQEVDVWMEPYRRFWQECFERLDELLVEMKAADAKTARSRKGGKRTAQKSVVASKSRATAKARGTTDDIAQAKPRVATRSRIASKANESAKKRATANVASRRKRK